MDTVKNTSATQDVRALEVPKKLLTIITEGVLEKTLSQEIEAFGATGYTVMDVRGKGVQGKRNAGWDHDSNIRIDVICSMAVANSILLRLKEVYYDNYAMVSFVQDVSVLRGEKFA